MPAYTAAQLETKLSSYVEPNGDFYEALSQVLPRIYSTGLWRDLVYETSLDGSIGYVSLPVESEAVLSCTINDSPRPVQSMWHDVRIVGRQAELSPYFGIVDDGYYPVLLDMKDVQGVAESADVTPVSLINAYLSGTSAFITTTNYAGTISIAGPTTSGQQTTLLQAASGNLTFSLPTASATLDPTGGSNAVTFTAVSPGEEGNLISVAYASPAAATEATVSVSGGNITVTPASKARMVVSGIVSPAAANGEYAWDGTNFSKAGFLFTVGTYGGIPGTTCWILSGEGLVAPTYFRSDGYSTYPDGEATWTAVYGGASGTMVVTAGATSAAQVIEAVNADEDASALVVATASGVVTGAVAAVAQTFLSGGGEGSAIVSTASITYDDVPAAIDLVDPAFPTKVIATIPAGSGVVRFRRFRLSDSGTDTVVHLLLKRACPDNIVGSTIIHLGNINAIKHALLGRIAEDNADVQRAEYHWSVVEKILDSELDAFRGAAKPKLMMNVWGNSNVYPIY